MINPCLTTSGASVSFSLSPVDMTYTVGNSAATQSPTANDSVSTRLSITKFCGNYVWSLVETISGLSINPTTGLITVSTINLANVGTYTATIQVGLSSYPDVAKASVGITIRMLNPCLTATISFST